MNRKGADLDGEHREAAGRDVTETFGVAGFTLISRVTGLLRVAVVGAVLGPTFFANIFQATNTVPNITYNLLAGSLLTTLIVPTLVEALDRESLARTRAVAQGLVGVVVAGFCGAGLVVLALGPVIVRLLTLGIHDHREAVDAAHQTWVLLLLVVPQIVLYGVAAVGVAAQNARRRFSLAAAAPAVENVGLIVTLLLAARWYGSGFGVHQVTSSCLVLLGVGATLSVAAHAALQLFGAARVGIPLWPRWGWSDPVVRALCRRMVPTIGTAMIDAIWFFALVVAAGTVPGGVVAIQIGFNFYNVPLALSARAVGTVMLPRLARDAVRGDLERFRQTYESGVSWAWFVAAPASVILVLLAKPISDALAFGQMAHHNGAALLAASVASMGLALIPAATQEFARYACYARGDVHSPLRAGVALILVTAIGIPIALTAFDGAAMLAALGVLVAVGQLVRCLIVDRAARRDTPHLAVTWWRPLLRHVVAALVAVATAAVVAHLVLRATSGDVRAITEVVLATSLGILGYAALQSALRAPELPMILRRRSPPVPVGAEGSSS
jgi:putative peptidoglycan lipid II flippase